MCNPLKLFININFIIAIQVCELVGQDIIEFDTVLQYFRDDWAPAICHLHTTGSFILSDFVNELCKAMDGLDVQEVCYQRPLQL